MSDNLTPGRTFGPVVRITLKAEDQRKRITDSETDSFRNPKARKGVVGDEGLEPPTLSV